MKTTYYGLALLVVFILTSCTMGIKTFSTESKGVDLKKYKTYAWVKPGDPEAEYRKDDKIYSGLILELANEELKKKGFALDTLQPEAVFAFDTRVSEQVDYAVGPPPTMGAGYGYVGYGYYGGYYAPVPVYSSSVTREEYEEGMLYIDMFDAKTKVPIWGGWAKAKLTAKSDVEADVRSAVKYIFMRLNVNHNK